MISVEEQLKLYEKIIDMSRSTLKLLEDDQVEDAMNLNSEKLGVIKYLAENKNDDDEIRDVSVKFCNDYFALNEMITAKISEIKNSINLSLKNGRITGRKVCTYQSVSRVGRTDS
jgi:hypothetical protein